MGSKEGSAYNGHFESVCYHPLFLFNGHGDCLAAKLRSGNVHSADDWDELLLPEIERQQGAGTRVAFRADAAFAKPAIYEAMEERGVDYAIRVPAKREPRMGNRRPSVPASRTAQQKPLVRYKSFRYQAGSWTQPRRVVAKVEHHNGRALPTRRVHRDESPAPESRPSCASTTSEAPPSSGSRKASRRRTGRDCRVIVPGQRSPTPVERVGLNLGNLWRRLVLPTRIDHWSLTSVQQRPRQDRRPLGETCAVLLAAAGRESSDQASVRGDAAADLGAAGPGGLTGRGTNERRPETSPQRGEVSEKCGGTEPFPVDSRPGRVTALGCRGLDGRRLETRLQPARGCSIGVFREGKMEIPGRAALLSVESFGVMGLGFIEPPPLHVAHRTTHGQPTLEALGDARARCHVGHSTGSDLWGLVLLELVRWHPPRARNCSTLSRTSEIRRERFFGGDAFIGERPCRIFRAARNRHGANTA